MLIVSLMGEQAITDAATGRSVNRSARVVTLVAFLAAHAGVPQPRQHIAALFWPDSSDAQALTNLRRELHHLRRVLADDESLVTTSTDLCWQDTETCRVDLRTFQQEATAAIAAGDVADLARHSGASLAAYGGDLLPGSYDDWVLEMRERLERTCVELCDLVCTTARRTGRDELAVEAARRRIRLRPLEESGHRTLMELQAALDDRAGAVSTYHHCASLLERELDVAPAPATTAVFTRLLRDESPDDGEQGHGTSGAGTARAGPADTRIVGRFHDLAALHALWHEASTAQAQVAVVRGVPGVGKTRLVAELADIVRRSGGVVATAQCFDTSGRISLAPVADWLRDPLIRSATERLAEVWRDEVDRLVPARHRAPPPDSTAPHRTMADAWQRHRFFDGLARSLLAVARPTLLVLDNLQWCGEETLDFLTFLLNRAREAPLMLAVTVREDHDNRPVSHWCTRLRESGTLTELTLGPFDRNHSAELAESLTGRPLTVSESALLHGATGGFPLYVVEACRSSLELAGAGTGERADLTAVLRRRLDQMTPAARDVASLAAALGHDFTLPLLAEASDLDTDSVVRGLDELWRRRIVRELDNGYDFSHDLLRDAAYAAVSPPHRWLLHRRLAQGIELLYRGRTDDVAAALAEQYRRAGNTERALTYYRRAAEVAAAVFAHAESARHHNQTLALLGQRPQGRQRDEQELRCLEALAPTINAMSGYSAPELEQTFHRVMALADRLGDTEALLNGMGGLWASYYVQGRTRQAHELAERMLTLLTPHDRQLGQAHFSVAGSLLHLGRPHAAVEHFDTALRSAGTTTLTVGTRASVHARAWSAHGAWLLGRPDEAARRCAESIADARTSGHPYSLAVALAFAGITAQLLGDRQRLDPVVEELRELCVRYDFAYYREWGLVLEGWSIGGAAGTARIRTGIDNLKAQNAFARMPYWLALLAGTLTDDHDAAATLDAALVMANSRQERWYVPELMRERAAFDTELRASERLVTAVGLARRHGSVTLLNRCERDLADLRRNGER
ncbi:DNA-binding SARP family transcriptional activator/tetratricopeptide (TPR) repeat protein [Prauserella sediminis]|uniref:DNA-binding SARP family transcriptional activator/tetratricopeptide (TPR) repeat protein n=1 Tax=Prauserella sediminis TaxID=577680 RepID=A0A839XFT8_9PSEU|nr:AAA family ATPase [Prauserella sediminis]MBB3661297.1 DNA-binding SARP family transcriptional activator/tetratricopeptide (TPR) repeat protein [Prauserella sediminis]